VDLSNLLSALLGAILGVVGAFALQVWDRRREDKGAGRALFFELVQNMNAVRVDRPFAVEGAWARSTWQVVQADMATFLDPATFGAIAWAYRCIEVADAGAARYGAGSAEHRALGGVPEDAFAKAVELLGPKIWRTDEIDALTSKMERPIIR
jgi:hypothetical protein